MQAVVIEVTGGVVHSAYTDAPVHIILVDWDNIQEGGTAGVLGSTSMDDMPIDTRAYYDKALAAESLALLMKLDSDANQIRKKLGLADRNALVWESSIDIDEKVVVEADGYGGGTYLHVQELGGCDRLVKDSKHFSDVNAACAYAAKICGVDEDEESDECTHPNATLSDPTPPATWHCPDCGENFIKEENTDGT